MANVYFVVLSSKPQIYEVFELMMFMNDRLKQVGWLLDFFFLHSLGAESTEHTRLFIHFLPQISAVFTSKKKAFN